MFLAFDEADEGAEQISSPPTKLLICVAWSQT